MYAMTQDEKKNESKSKPDAMTQGGNQEGNLSKVATLIKEIDAIFIEAGLGEKFAWGKPEPNHHRVIIRFQGKKKD